MPQVDSKYSGLVLNTAGVQVNGQQLYPMWPTRGRDWFVDGNVGSDSNDGTSWAEALLTMNRVFTNGLASGDRIYFTGNIAEQLVTPAGVFDVAIIGAGTNPRHPDAHTGNNGYTSARWKLPASPVAATPCLKVLQQGWRFVNFLWTADTSQECCRVFRDGGAGDAERDASHAEFIGMRFDGAGVGIMAHGGPNWVRVENCRFRGMTTGIGNTTGAGIGTNHMWEIVGNRFTDNTNHVVIPLNMGVVARNVFGKFTTKALDLTGGAGSNQVVGNYMSGDYDAAYVAAASDNWIGNIAEDVASGETEADGATNSVPVA
jgi:hypothetical protein